MSISQNKLSLILCFFFICAFFEGAVVEAETNQMNLPKAISHWIRPDSPRVIDSNNIFDYMNGAGEIYLGYRFQHINVFEYMSENQNNIQVELYFMENSDDAFGLLSLDWGGEPVSFSSAPENRSKQSLTLWPSALYGAGLLRMWSNNLYARVMATRETTASKQAVLALGKAISGQRKRPFEPELLKILPLHIGSAWKLRTDRLSFFRSYLVLNSIYYISHENILNLDLSTEAVIAPYERISSESIRKRVQFLLIKYESQDLASKALNHFHNVYLPEHKKKEPVDQAAKDSSLFKLEDGWLAYKFLGNYIAIVFECPDQDSPKMIIQKNESNLLKKEGSHES